MVDLDQQLQKALLLADTPRIDEAESILRQIILLADETGDRLTSANARCALGELLIGEGQTFEAIEFLEPVADVDENDDLLSNERALAIGLIQRAGND